MGSNKNIKCIIGYQRLQNFQLKVLLKELKEKEMLRELKVMLKELKEMLNRSFSFSSLSAARSTLASLSYSKHLF